MGATRPDGQPDALRSPARSPTPRPAAQPEARGLLAAAAERLRRATRCDAVLAWANDPEGRAHLAAAAYTGEPPAEPGPGELEALAARPGAVDLRGDAGLRGIAARHGCQAAAAVRGPDGACLAVLLIRETGRPRPRLLATLEAAAQRLADPLASALRLERLDAEVRRLDRLATLGSLAAEIAHEIRNPLASLKTFVQLAPERRDDPEFLGRFAARVADELRRIERLLDRMLEQGRPEPEVGGSAPPGAAVEAVAELLGPRASQSGVRLETRVEPGLPEVPLSPDALRQVLLNLALNALAATPAGGAVHIGAAARAGEILFRVADEGPGVAPELRTALFEPFVSDRAGRPGGLGLAITRRLVEQAGGSIECGDRPGGGAELRVSFPARRPTREPADAQRAEGERRKRASPASAPSRG